MSGIVPGRGNPGTATPYGGVCPHCERMDWVLGHGPADWVSARCHECGQTTQAAKDGELERDHRGRTSNKLYLDRGREDVFGFEVGE